MSKTVKRNMTNHNMLNQNKTKKKQKRRHYDLGTKVKVRSKDVFFSILPMIVVSC